MNENYFCTSFVAEPGDGTRYSFSVCNCPSTISGVGDGSGYVVIVCHMEPGFSVVLGRDFQLETDFGYALGKTMGNRRYTLAAIMLATRGILDRDNNWETRMLRAPDFI